MSTFDHSGLIHNINTNIAPLRKAQPEAMAGFGQLAKAAMAEGAVSAKNKAVCVYMGGAPALMYAAEAVAAWEQMAPAQTLA